MPRARRTAGAARVTPVETFVHGEEQRTNIPTAELETFMKDEDRAPKTATYSRPSELLYPRDPAGDPQLVWRGKDELDRQPLEVMAPPIYIQEKIHPKAIIEDLRRQESGDAPAQADLFSDFNGIEFEDLVDFYQHEQHWSNRMILGDSLEVMTSLADRESLKGQVQCVYMDPPYGVHFSSNWQVSTRSRDVRDGNATDTIRQPEQVKAFRDTWLDGIHTYLSYLRDRLVVARSLLTPSGSLFLQMGDTNLHLARAVLDEVFGAANFCSVITVKKTGGLGTDLLKNVTDYVLWYARDRTLVKYRQLYFTKAQGVGQSTGARYDQVLLPDGEIRPLSPDERAEPSLIPHGARTFQLDNLVSSGHTPSCIFSFAFDGQSFTPGGQRSWKTNREGMAKLATAGRLASTGRTLRYVRFLDDFAAYEPNNVWDDVSVGTDKVYVVQTPSTVIARALLMTTDPGDLIVDPTCGGGTSAWVAEQWGRRWITIDTSRVALALARQRLMAARFPKYALQDPSGKDLRRGFVCKMVSHVTLRSIANNPELREGMGRSEIDAAIARHADQEVLHDQPEVEKSVVRVAGPFTVESLSPLLGAWSENAEESAPERSVMVAADDFEHAIIENLRAAGVQNTVRKERLKFDRLEAWPGKYINAVGEYSEEARPRRAAVTIGPQYGTVDADLVRAAAKEAAGFFDILIVCGFAFDAYIANEFKQLGNLTILKANMNPDLSMGGDLLKKTGTGNLFMVFGEPDIDIRHEDGQVEVEIKGLDVYDPTTGQIRAHTTADIACWFIDTAYDGNSFFVRHAYFTGAGDPYKSLKAALKADIDEAAWASLYSTVSRPFAVPSTGRIAVKVINHYGDEVMKVYEIPEAAAARLPV